MWALHSLTSSGSRRGLAVATQLPLTALAIAGLVGLLRRSGREQDRRFAISLSLLAVALLIPPLVTMPWTRYYAPLIPILAPLVAATGVRQ